MKDKEINEERSLEFERCIDYLAELIEKYSSVIFEETEQESDAE